MTDFLAQIAGQSIGRAYANQEWQTKFNNLQTKNNELTTELKELKKSTLLLMNGKLKCSCLGGAAEPGCEWHDLYFMLTR